MEDTIRNQLIDELERRMVKEGIGRINRCLEELSFDEVWFRPNDNSNSIGNLILHLGGNVKQWLIATFQQIPDTRQRDEEFSAKGSHSIEELKQILVELQQEIMECLPKITANSLMKSYPVQGFHETGTAIVVHVIEHFSYHVGQITYFTKAKKDLDLGYYAGVELG